MGLPLQNIPEADKTPEWAIDCTRSIMRMVGNTTLSKEKDRFCYNLHDGIFNEADFDYLRKVDSYEYPAKIRFIPLLRPKCDLLKSRETERPFNVRAFTVDLKSLSNKQDQMAKAVLNKVEQRLLERYEAIKMATEEISTKQGEIDMMIQQAQQPQQPPAEGGPPQQPQQIDPAMMKQLNVLKRKLEMMKSPLKREELITTKDLEEIETYYKFKFRDYLEVMANKSISYALHKYNLKEVFNDGFEDRIVVDKEYYFVNWSPGQKDPTLRRVKPMNFWHSKDYEATWVGDCSWAMEERLMSFNQIVDEFASKGKIKKEDLEKIAKRSGLQYNYELNTYSPYQFGNQYDYSTDNCSGTVYSGNEDYAANIRVCYCYWQSVRQIRFKKSPNKNNDKMKFTKWMNDKDKAREGDEIETKFVNDVWSGICIDNEVFICCEKMEVQLRSIDEKGPVQLPYIGMTRKPYSLVWAAKDIQILYNIVHYHKELMLALAGVRGFIMDKSQIPDGMSPQEWQYQKKLGTGWIQTVKEGSRSNHSNFNQFQQYDDSISPSVQFLIQILNHLEELASSVTGISRQSMGTVTSDDQVSTYNQSITQSSLVTKIIFWRHDQVKRKALERWVNLCKLSWKDGKRASFMFDDFVQEILDIPANSFENADYELFASDGSVEERKIQELRGMIAQEYGKGTISLPQIISIQSLDSLKEIEIMATKYYEMAEQKMAGNQENAQQFEQQKIQMEQEFQVKLKQMDGQLKQLDIEVKKASLQLESQKFAADQDYKNRELQTQSSLKDKDNSTQRQIEMAYLEEEKRQANMDFAIETEKLHQDQSTGNEKVGSMPQKEKIVNK